MLRGRADSKFSHVGGTSNGLELGSGTSSFIRSDFNNSDVTSANKSLLQLVDGHQMRLHVRPSPHTSTSARRDIGTCMQNPELVMLRNQLLLTLRVAWSMHPFYQPVVVRSQARCDASLCRCRWSRLWTASTRVERQSPRTGRPKHPSLQTLRREMVLRFWTAPRIMSVRRRDPPTVQQ